MTRAPDATVFCTPLSEKNRNGKAHEAKPKPNNLTIGRHNHNLLPTSKTRPRKKSFRPIVRYHLIVQRCFLTSRTAPARKVYIQMKYCTISDPDRAVVPFCVYANEPPDTLLKKPSR